MLQQKQKNILRQETWQTDELFDEDHFLEFDSIDDSDDLCRGLKDLILDDADYDDDVYRGFVENLNIELIDITDNAAQVLYNSFGAFDVQYDEFALRLGQLLSETDVIHESKYQKIYIAGGDLAKEHLGSLKQFMMLDKVYSIFLVVYPDETVVIGYGEFESQNILMLQIIYSFFIEGDEYNGYCI